ncbi:unnamed protein product [Leptidea sinapis]|uniref:Uncharacterized protein n=1 Tax=Leptidea sinapis TaxID=189913 RepID=A0A5E4R693_9NEOP|nr:unnamed protein product [Leptidea sinapis]
MDKSTSIELLELPKSPGAPRAPHAYYVAYLCLCLQLCEARGHSLRSGAGRDELYVSKWYAFQAMMFIQERNRPRSTASTEDRPHSSMSTNVNS